MDDATTAFATACAVIAASTGMVLCLAPKSVNDAIIDEEQQTPKESKGVVVVVEGEGGVAATIEDAVKKEVTAEPKLEEEPVITTDEPTNDITATTTTTDAIPEQRPDDSAINGMASPVQKKRRFTLRGDRSHRIFEGKAPTKPKFKKAQSMKWLPFRPNHNEKNEAGNVGQEV